MQKVKKLQSFHHLLMSQLIDLLESLNTPAFKVSSFELVDLPLIEYIAKKNQ